MNIFDTIYLDGGWGEPFSSGPGSHHEPLVAAYVDAIKKFLISQSCDLKTALDVGCGDFNIGQNLYSLFNSYYAIDISPVIIERNRKAYQANGLSFATRGGHDSNLGFYDVIFIRQVFQHLPNQEIHSILSNIKEKCAWMIITEHIPEGAYKPNLDHLSHRRDTRLQLKSGVDILREPFGLKPMQTLDLVRYAGWGGIILTQAHQMRESTSRINSFSSSRGTNR